MADTCPRGGEHIWVADTENTSQWKCRKCGKTKPKEEKPKPQKEKIPFNTWTAIAAFLEFIFFYFLFFLTPIPNIINIGLQYITPYIPAGLLAFLGGSYFILGVVVLLFGIILLNTVVIRQLDIGAMFQEIHYLFFTLDFVLGAMFLFWLGIQNSTYFDQYICLTTNLVTLSKISPDLTQRCVAYQSSQIPQCQKATGGVTEPLKISFEYTSLSGTTLPPSIPLQGQVYDLPVTLENLDTKNDLSGVVVKGYMDNGTCSPGTDCINMKSVSLCTDDNPCAIPAGQSIPISLRGDAAITDKVGTFENFVITVSFPGVAYGSSNFEVIRGINDVSLIQNQENKPQCSSGPMDVVIYYLGNYYLASTAQQNQVMYFAIANNGNGVGRLTA